VCIVLLHSSCSNPPGTGAVGDAGWCQGASVRAIYLMAEVTAIGFVVPILDPCNAGANAAGWEGNEVVGMAIVAACAARAAESKGDGVGGAPQLEPRAMVAVEGECGIEGNRASRKHATTDD
jgi:hypothetical protein